MSAAYALIAHALIFAALCASLPMGVLKDRMGLIATIFALFAGIAPAMHGILGAPSLTLCAIAVRSLTHFPPIQWNRFYLGLFLLFVFPFYYSSLGATDFDLYAQGYSPDFILLSLLPLGLFFYFKRFYFALFILTLDLIAWRLGLFQNLWDSLFCFPLVLFLIFQFFFFKKIK